MTPRERVLAAINHREPDRVPIDLGSTIVTGIMAVPYRQLKMRWGLDGLVKVHDWKQQLALVEEPVLQKIGVDVRPTLPEVWYPECPPAASTSTTYIIRSGMRKASKI